MKKILNIARVILTKEWVSELLKYFVAGGVAFILDFSVMMFLYKVCGVYYLTAAAIGLLVGLLITYLLSIKWVFKNQSIANKKVELSLFVIIGIIGLLINEYVIWISVETFLQSVPISKLIATVIVFIWNFTARKLMLFRADVVPKE